jgi:hypothetical protein
MRLLPAALLGLVVSVAASAPDPRAQAEPSGTIVGTVRLTSRIRGTPLPSSAYPNRRVGEAEAPAIPEIRNVVVYLKNPPFHGTLPLMTSELRQEHEAFVPHVLAITRGSTVDFPNRDPFFHNVFSLSGAAAFNLGRYAHGKSRSYVFRKAGLVKVYCDIHSHMNAAIIVFDHPFFTIPKDDGTFEIRNVPVGQLTIVGWHERVGDRSVPVKVEAGRTVKVELTLPVEDTK